MSFDKQKSALNEIDPQSQSDYHLLNDTIVVDIHNDDEI